MSVQRDIDAELRFHLDSRVEELMAQGMSRDEAQSQATREFGDVDEVRDGLRAIDRRLAHRRSRVEQLWSAVQDLKYATRSLSRSAVVSLTIVLTLSLGIGVNAAMFSLLDTIYLRPPAGVANPGALRRLWVEVAYRNGPQYSTIFDYQGFLSATWAAAGRASVFAYRAPAKMTIGRGENAPTVRVSMATGRYFDVLGVRPARGRLFGDEEAAPDVSARVIVISDALWSREFARDPNVLGKQLTLGRVPFVVIGIAPPEFRGIDLDAAEAWITPGALMPNTPDRPWWRNPNVNGFQVVERLASNAPEGELLQKTIATLRNAEVGGIRYDSTAVPEFGAINRERGPGTVSGEMQVAKRLAGVSVLVLLIAIANIVNLLLARAMSRRREIAVRLALGISRPRLIRLLLAESMILATVAAIAAVAMSVWASAIIQHLLIPDVEWSATGVDGRLLSFALIVALVCGIVMGLVPALQTASPDLTEGLRAGARDMWGGRSRLRNALVSIQAALSVVLLIGAVLFVRSLTNVKAHDVGYSIDRLVLGQVSYDTRDSLRDAALPGRLRALSARIRAIDGVQDVAFTSMPPKSGFATVNYFAGADTGHTKLPMGIWTAVTPNYFDVTGTRLLRGRTFAPDGADGATSVIVNQAMADAIWPNEDALGKCIRFEKPTNPCATVIGVSATVILTSLDEKPEAAMYVSADRAPFWTWGGSSVVVNATAARTTSVAVSLRDILRSEFSGAIPRTRTMTEVMAPTYRPWTIGAELFTAFGVLALVVATIGVYSSVSYAVTRRTHEFGVRLALGAQTRDVLRQVLTEGVKVVASGVLLGVLLAVAAGKIIRSLLYGVGPNDPVALAGVALILLLAAIIAALRPAMRAAHADPVSALRAD